MAKDSKLKQSPIYSAICESGHNLQYVADSIGMNRATLSHKLAEETIQICELRQLAGIIGTSLRELLNRIHS